MSLRIDGAFLFGASIVFSIVISSFDSSCRHKANGRESINLLPEFSLTPLLDENHMVSNRRTKTDSKPVNEAMPAVSIAKPAVEIEGAVDQVSQPCSENEKPVGKYMEACSIPKALDVSSAAAATLAKEEFSLFPAVKEENVAVATEKEENSASLTERKITQVSSVITAPESSFSIPPSEDLDAGIDIGIDAVCITVSAPGKALVAGGYLVLEPSNIGITISSTSRFYSTVAVLKAPHEDLSKYQLRISVESPQFNTSFEYQYDIHFDSLVATSDSKNVFVEKCLSMVLSYTKESLGYGVLSDVIASVSAEGKLGVKLRADNDFYSQIKELQARGLPLDSYSLGKLPKFNPCPKDSKGNTEVIKTGMGSSAALATSLVGALLSWFKVIRLNSTVKIAEDRRVLHNLAQLAHAVAQGKIGSGFDVAAAVYGTQIYKRFAPEGLMGCLNKATPYEIYSAVNDRSLWTHTITCFSLPPQMDLVMGDVCGGSSSVSMAKQVLQWRVDKPDEAYKIWEALADVNEEIQSSLEELWHLAEADPDVYADSLSRASKSTYAQWLAQISTSSASQTVTERLVTLRKLFSSMRELLRTMGREAGVGIEPPSQTALADRTEALPGVLCAGVPGAGGIDAVFAIVLSYTARSQVEDMWSALGSEGGPLVCPLLLSAEGGLDGGVRVEDLPWM